MVIELDYLTATATVLLVDDDEIDIENVHRGFEKLKIANPIRDARDGIEALDILRGTNGQEKLPRPFIILLDINMPRMGGLEFLEELREDDELKDAVVFVLTTSNDEKDRLQAYNYNVAGYLLKNKAGPSFINALDMLDHYWRVVELPVGKS